MSFENEGLCEAPSKEAGLVRRNRERSKATPLYNSVTALLSAETACHDAANVWDRLAMQYEALQANRADEDSLQEIEDKLQETRRAAVTANLLLEQAQSHLRKAVCSMVGWRMWRPILGTDPEEVAHVVLEQFFKNQKPWNGAEHATNWIHKATQHRIADLLRKEGVRGGGDLLPGDDEEEEEGSKTESPEEITLGSERITSEVPLPPNDQDIPAPDDIEGEVIKREELEIWRGKLLNALDAAHNAIKTRTKIENPDEIHRVFEKMVRYELTPREIVAQAQTGSPYAVINESKEEWKRATNLVSKHKERYQTALKEVVESECLCPEHQAILSNLLLYVKSEPGRKASSEASGPAPSEEKSAAAAREGSLAAPSGRDDGKRRQGQRPVESADRIQRKAAGSGGRRLT